MSVLSFMSASVFATVLVTLPGSDPDPWVAVPAGTVVAATVATVPTAAPEIPVVPMLALAIPPESNTAPTNGAGSGREITVEATMPDRENRGKAFAAFAAALFLGAQGSPGLH